MDKYGLKTLFLLSNIQEIEKQLLGGASPTPQVPGIKMQYFPYIFLFIYFRCTECQIITKAQNYSCQVYISLTTASQTTGWLDRRLSEVLLNMIYIKAMQPDLSFIVYKCVKVCLHETSFRHYRLKSFSLYGGCKKCFRNRAVTERRINVNQKGHTDAGQRATM